MRVSELLNEKPVESTWITDLRYSRANKLLTMSLSNGRRFTFSGITRATFEQWTKAPSIGRYYHQKIKNNYPATRIK
jgi:hypothetical protein